MYSVEEKEKYIATFVKIKKIDTKTWNLSEKLWFVCSSVGHEYEVMLHRKLSALGIPFQTEDDLRDLGCDKTPDIKLHVPIGKDPSY